jgi:threonine dehydrogenase-like Zn-dependent dehydrogenase
MSTNDTSLSVILEGPEKLNLREIEVPIIPGNIERITMQAVGICGSDVRYFQGENPWALHTLGRHVPSPPNMVLGHEVAGIAVRNGRSVPVAILAYKACGTCIHCRRGDENLCSDMAHFGHSAGWKDMEFFPGGMAHKFTIWDGFAYELPATVGFESATFLDGLAVAIHSLDCGGLAPGMSVAVLGLGPIGLLAAQAAVAQGADYVTGCDILAFPVELAKKVGIEHAVVGPPGKLAKTLKASSDRRIDIVVDTVGTDESIAQGLDLLEKRGTVVLLAVHDANLSVRGTALSGERSIKTSSNNRYADFPRAIELLSKGAVLTEPLVTHRFPLRDVGKAFDVMLRKDAERAFKVVIVP